MSCVLFCFAWTVRDLYIDSINKGSAADLDRYYKIKVNVFAYLRRMIDLEAAQSVLDISVLELLGSTYLGPTCPFFLLVIGTARKFCESILCLCCGLLPVSEIMVQEKLSGGGTIICLFGVSYSLIY